MASGIIHWTSPDARFCIIAPDEGGEEIIVLLSDVRKQAAQILQNGQHVEYRISRRDERL